VDLKVRIWGMSAEGRPFSQHARAYNISSEGALISGVDNELKVGDVIGVQFDDKKTRCTVIWVMNTGPVKKNEVGIRLVADQDCPWKSYLPIDGAPPAMDLLIGGAFTGTRFRFLWRCATSASTRQSASMPPM